VAEGGMKLNVVQVSDLQAEWRSRNEKGFEIKWHARSTFQSSGSQWFKDTGQWCA